MARAATTQANPPETTAACAVKAEAARPDSTSPRRGPLVTTSMNTDDMRPRMASGVAVWLIVVRQTALTLSAAPASASSAAARRRRGRGPQRRHEAGGRDREPPDQHGGDRDPPEPVRRLQPPGGQ